MKPTFTKIKLLGFTLALFLACATLPGFAQAAKLDLTNLEKLASKAVEVNDVTLDGAVLDMARKFLENRHDPDVAKAKEAMKGLQAIYIKNFEFDGPDQYSQADVEAIRAQLARPGWSRVVQSRNRRSHENDEIYIMKQGESIAGMAILIAEERELTVVNIVGSIDIDKLGDLSGHLGIPRVKDNDDDKHRPKSKDAKPSKDKDNKKDDDEEADDDN